MNWSSYTTRKVVLGAGAIILIAGGWVASQWLPVAGDHYGTFVAGVGAIYATFCGANTLQDHILKNKAPAKPKSPVEPIPEEK